MTFLITRDSCRKAKISYSYEELAKLIPSEGLTPLQVVKNTTILVDDQYWMLVYASNATDRILREHACWCARQALSSIENPDPRSIQAIEVAEKFARGEATLEELDTTQKAAWSAADAAAKAAKVVKTATRHAVYATYAANAACAAAETAAYYVNVANAAWNAAWYAVRVADNTTNTVNRGIVEDTRKAQVQDLVRRLTKSNFSKKIKTKTRQISRWRNLGI
jgi:hypothetical protein